MPVSKVVKALKDFQQKGREYYDNMFQFQRDLENDHRLKMGQDTVEDEEKKTATTAYQARKKYGPGFWSGDIGPRP